MLDNTSYILLNMTSNTGELFNQRFMTHDDAREIPRFLSKLLESANSRDKGGL